MKITTASSNFSCSVIVYFPFSEQFLTEMSVLSISNDPRSSQAESAQFTQLLLQAYPRSPVFPEYSRDVTSDVEIHLLNKLGTFLVSIIHQQWRQDQQSTTIVPATRSKNEAQSSVNPSVTFIEISLQ